MGCEVMKGKLPKGVSINPAFVFVIATALTLVADVKAVVNVIVLEPTVGQSGNKALNVQLLEPFSQQ